LPHPKSAIFTSDFKTVNDLADHLVYLSGNETAYNEYLEWKTLPYSDNFQALVDYENEYTPFCRMAMLLKGLYANPLKRFETAKRFGGIKLPQPAILGP
jgi:hypothetical protein